MYKSNILKDIVLASWDKPRRGIPCLVGPTQWGKNTFVEALGKELERPVVPINVQIRAEEDLGGLPIKRFVTNGHGREVEVFYSTPPVISSTLKAFGADKRDDYILFVDELDKPRQELLACILSLLDDQKRIGHYIFPKNVNIICAMNPPQRNLIDPLLARLFFLPFPWGDEYYNLVAPSYRSMFKRLYGMPETGFPARPDSPGSFYHLVEWFDHKPFWENQTVKELIVRGWFSPKKVPEVMKELVDSPNIDFVTWVKKGSAADLAHGFVHRATEADNETKVKMLQELAIRAEKDKTGEITRIWNSFVSTPKSAGAVGYNDQNVLETGQKALLDSIGTK